MKILKAELPWTLLALAWIDEGSVLHAQTGLRALMRRFPFAVCVPFGTQTTPGGSAGSRTGLLFRAAAYEAPPDALLDTIEGWLNLATPEPLRYVDRRRGQRRAIRLVRSDTTTRLDAFLLAGDTSAEGWIKTLLQEQLGAQDYGRLLLRPGARPPVALQPRGKAVCSCFGVSLADIDANLRTTSGTPEQRLASMQVALSCGTNCGSCVPELQRLVRAAPLPVPASA